MNYLFDPITVPRLVMYGFVVAIVGFSVLSALLSSQECEKKPKKKSEAPQQKVKTYSYEDLPKNAKVFIHGISFKFDYYQRSRIFFKSKDKVLKILSFPDTVKFIHVDRHYELKDRS
jgi:hypothetical protein